MKSPKLLQEANVHLLKILTGQTLFPLNPARNLTETSL